MNEHKIFIYSFKKHFQSANDKLFVNFDINFSSID